MLSDKLFQVAEFLDQIVLWILILLSIISVGTIIERFLVLRKVFTASEKIRQRIRMALQMNQMNEVENLAQDMESLEGRAINLALKHVKLTGDKGIAELFDSFTLTEKPELESKLNFLATIGSNAPYIGLFGTVLGIMKAFNDLAQVTDGGSQTVMAGISAALVATAAGLFVAIPAVAFYNYFQKQVAQILQNLENAKELCLAFAKQKGS
jgi:biopolymer transport protein TolQ